MSSACSGSSVFTVIYLLTSRWDIQVSPLWVGVSSHLYWEMSLWKFTEIYNRWAIYQRRRSTEQAAANLLHWPSAEHSWNSWDFPGISTVAVSPCCIRNLSAVLSTLTQWGIKHAFFWGPRVFPECKRVLPEEKRGLISEKHMKTWKIYLVGDIYDFHGVIGFIGNMLVYIVSLYMM